MKLLDEDLRQSFENRAKWIVNQVQNRKQSIDGFDFNFYTPKPGHPDWNAVEKRARELADRALDVIEVDTGSPAEAVAEARRISDALSLTAKKMVVNHKRLKNGSGLLIPPYFIWTMHNTCNFRCSYCDNHREQKYFDLPNDGKLDTETGRKLLRIARKDVTGIYFCGGEPTLRKDLPELVDYAHSINYFPLMINTNGSRLHKLITQENSKKWLKQMDIIIVSLDALDTGMLAGTWGVKNDLCEQVMVNILALRMLQEKVRFKLIVNTVITPETVGEAASILDWANDLGIWFSPVPMNCGPDVNSSLLDDSGYSALTRRIVERKEQGYKIVGSKKLIKMLIEGGDIECFPTLKPHIDIDGSLIWPCKGVVNFEPVKINVLNYNSLDEAYHAAERMISVDNIHGHESGQCGADCNWMQNYVSHTIAQGLKAPLNGRILREIAEFVGVV